MSAFPLQAVGSHHHPVVIPPVAVGTTVSGQETSANVILHPLLRNPLLAGADPSIVYHEGRYYLVQSDRFGIVIYHAATLADIGRANQVTRVFFAPRTGPLSRNIWAPELHLLGGRWYIYFAADDGRNENHRAYALVSSTDSPMGPYEVAGKIACAEEDRWAIDATVLEVNGELYCLWSGWEGPRNGMQHLYISAMADPLTLCGSRVRISSPTEAWERRSGPFPCYVNEGPALLQRNGKIYLTYSANGFWSDDYCLGLLTCTDGNVMNPESWVKHHGPVLAKTDEAFNVGHNCFVKSPDQTEDWILYHAVAYPHSGGRHRTIRAQKVAWGADNMPHFGRPVPVRDPLVAPSGESPLGALLAN